MPLHTMLLAPERRTNRRWLQDSGRGVWIFHHLLLHNKHTTHHRMPADKGTCHSPHELTLKCKFPWLQAAQLGSQAHISNYKKRGLVGCWHRYNAGRVTAPEDCMHSASKHCLVEQVSQAVVSYILMQSFPFEQPPSKQTHKHVHTHTPTYCTYRERCVPNTSW